MTRILVALFALSLISGMAVAQTAKAPAKAATAAAANADLLDNQVGDQRPARRCTGYRSGLLAENHRRAGPQSSAHSVGMVIY